MSARKWTVSGRKLFGEPVRATVSAPDVFAAAIRAKRRRGVHRARSVVLAETPAEKRRTRARAIAFWRGRERAA